MKWNGEPLSVCNLSDWCRTCIRFNTYYISRAMDMNWLWLTLLTPSPAQISRTNEISPTWNYPFSTILLNLVLLPVEKDRLQMQTGNPVFCAWIFYDQEPILQKWWSSPTWFSGNSCSFCYWSLDWAVTLNHPPLLAHFVKSFPKYNYSTSATTTSATLTT